VSVNGTLAEDKIRRFKGECAQFGFLKCIIYTHDGAIAKFSTNSQETDYSVLCKEISKEGPFTIQAKYIDNIAYPSYLVLFWWRDPTNKNTVSAEQSVHSSVGRQCKVH
jgi:hypothetical protein